MRYCRYLQISIVYRIVGMIVFLTTILALYSAGLYLILYAYLSQSSSYAEIVASLLISVLALIIASFFLFFNINFLKMETRKYSICENGIILNDKRKSYYEWSEIFEVAIVAFAASASLQSYQSVICVLIKPKTNDFLDKMLHSYMFGVLSRESVVIIDYTPELADEFKALFPGEIVDYRTTLRGRGLREP